MSERGEELKLNFKLAAISALGISIAVLVTGIIRPLLDQGFGANWRAHFRFALPLAAILGGAWFILMFAYYFFASIAARPAESILSEEAEASSILPARLSGFVAMEYYNIIFNRTFLIAVAPEGLYGWKVAGWFASADPNFYLPFQDLLNSDFMRDIDAIRKLSALRGSFFIPRSHILKVLSSLERKWGMGAVLHSGRVSIELSTGKTLEYILLGSVSPESIRQTVVLGDAPIPLNRDDLALPYIARHNKTIYLPLIACSLALSIFFTTQIHQPWATHTWPMRIGVLSLIALPFLLIREFFQVVVFTDTSMKWRTFLGKQLQFAYTEIQSVMPSTGGSLRLNFIGGKNLLLSRGLGDPHKIRAILDTKTHVSGQ